MNKCPFWSTSREKIECNNECPMNKLAVEDQCPFKQYLEEDKFMFKGIIDEDIDYSREEFNESFLGIRIDKQSSNY